MDLPNGSIMAIMRLLRRITCAGTARGSRPRLSRRKARGSAPGPRQGALPLGSPPRAEPLEPAPWLRCGRGVSGPAWAAAGASAIADAPAAAQASPETPRPHRNQGAGSKGSALGGDPRGSAPWRGPGAEPLAFLRLRRGLEPRAVPAQVIRRRSRMIAMIDPFGRSITYLRVSVTDRCDFRCVYCMAEDMHFLPKADLLTLEELDRLCSAFIARGVRKLRLTGGEPLVRRGIMTLFASLSRHLESGHLDELTLTTNGSQLAKHAAELKAAGVRRINVSLDTLDAEKFRAITRWGSLDHVLGGIDAALTAGLKIKINTVALKGVNEDEIPHL